MCRLILKSVYCIKYCVLNSDKKCICRGVNCVSIFLVLGSIGFIIIEEVEVKNFNLLFRLLLIIVE